MAASPLPAGFCAIQEHAVSADAWSHHGPTLLWSRPFGGNAELNLCLQGTVIPTSAPESGGWHFRDGKLFESWGVIS